MGYKYKKTLGDRVFDIFIACFIVLVVFVCLYPLIYVFSMAVSDPVRVARGEVYMFPKGFSLIALKKVLTEDNIATYYFNTLWFTVVGTVLGIIVTTLAAYPLARTEFRYRSTVMKFITVTMFFGGGLIPTYIVVARFLHLYNSRWAIVLPALTSAWNIIITRNYFQSLPEELIESARLDGASEFRIFGQLVVPLSKPIIGVLGLYNSVYFWNNYFEPMIYLGKKELHPLSLYVRNAMMKNSIESLAGSADFMNVDVAAMLSGIQVKYAAVVIVVVPMLLFYPLISKNLEKGLMIGALKA